MPETANSLKSALWEAANVLRGSAVDRTDWKGYILPLLFFKRISDVFDEETAEAREIYGGADPSRLPEVHRFVLPDGCHWNDVRQVAANVGAALQKAMQEIERTNPDTLFRVFGSADWGNREKFSDELLKDLTEGFSEIRLGNRAVTTDVLGDAYEYLVGKFADVTRRNKAGEFYTPRSVVRMMVEILDPQEGESIYDPACGTGGMLLGAIELLGMVNIPSPERRLDSYPHELSGGTRQRVMIAMALASEPKLLIADEPTTALDVTVQAQLLELLLQLQRELGMAIILITHDLGIVAEFAERVVVMYAGGIVEQGPVTTIFAAPRHPYTEGLLANIPPIDRDLEMLTTIEGSVPPPGAILPGCRFMPRCGFARPPCAIRLPDLLAFEPGHRARCIRHNGYVNEKIA